MGDSSESRILLDRLSHVRYGHPDFTKLREFMLDFGLVPVEESDDKIYFRGFGVDQFVYVAEKTSDGKRKFRGGAWIVQSMTELEKASQLPGASSIQDYKAPGGGKVVIVKDNMGEEVTLIYGQTDREQGSKEVPPLIKWNTWHEKPRRGEFQRPETNSPSKVHKLGHYGFEVAGPKLTEVYDWYTSTFNLKLSDTIFLPDSKAPMMHFLHLDKGEEWVDHHVSEYASETVQSNADGRRTSSLPVGMWKAASRPITPVSRSMTWTASWWDTITWYGKVGSMSSGWVVMSWEVRYSTIGKFMSQG